MQLTQADINELKDIYRRQYGCNLPDDEAWPMARDLLYIFSLIYEPPPEKEACYPKDKTTGDNMNVYV